MTTGVGVGRFHEYLESYLSTNIGQDAKIWRDERLRENHVFANEIVKQTRNSKRPQNRPSI